MSLEARRIAVVMGGMSAEREVSLQTGKCVVEHLVRRHRVKPVVILASGLWCVPGGFVGSEQTIDPSGQLDGETLPILSALQRILEEGTEVVFNALHGPGGEDGSFQGLLRHVGLPFTGPDVIPAATTMDKRLTKEALRGALIATPRSFRIPAAGSGSAVDWTSLARRQADLVPLPWIVKPNRLGSSVGVQVFESEQAFVDWGRALDQRRRDPDAEASLVDEHLVEEIVTGRELTCGVLETKGAPRALPPIEIRPRRGGLFDYHAKYTPGASEEICPAPLAEDETKAFQRIAVQVHRLFGCEPLSRTDAYLLADGQFSVLEVNTLPGMTATSLIPLSARQCGLALEDIFDELVEHAIERSRRWSSFLRVGVCSGKSR